VAVWASFISAAFGLLAGEPPHTSRLALNFGRRQSTPTIAHSAISGFRIISASSISPA
jgi:hypothetical protein